MSAPKSANRLSDDANAILVPDFTAHVLGRVWYAGFQLDLSLCPEHVTAARRGDTLIEVCEPAALIA
jgi:hypothetical protein